MSADIEPTSTGYGVIRPGGHTFTRRTYRVARRRATGRLLAARDAHAHALHKYGRTGRVTITALEDLIIADWETRQIVGRGRREGMWT